MRYNYENGFVNKLFYYKYLLHRNANLVRESFISKYNCLYHSLRQGTTDKPLCGPGSREDGKNESRGDRMKVFLDLKKHTS